MFTRFKKYSQNSIQQSFMDSKNLFIDETKIGSKKYPWDKKNAHMFPKKCT
jgi:hypothetical protein